MRSPTLGRRVTTVVAAMIALTAATVAANTPPATATATPVGPSLPLSQTTTWITDAQGRVVVLHGFNQVFKVAPYEPSADGFGADDAAFLEANGFDAVRVGVIWSAVEPKPGVYDDAYLTSIASTVSTLRAHGIVSLLDFHQDLYNEEFQGEGAPAWATQDGGLPNPPLGFPGNYFANPAEHSAWEAFWRNAPAADGVGLQDHYARAWAHVAAKFRGNTSVFGYEVMNEPWPGSLWEQCLVPIVGCPLFDATLTSFYTRVITAVRATDPVKTIWFEPNVLFNEGINTNIPALGDAHTGFAFHDYCGVEAEAQNNTTCPQEDSITFGNGTNYSRQHAIPQLVTEYGATNDLANLQSVMSLADQNKVGWLEWAYTGGDITSSAPDAQALVLDPSKPPTGSNVLTAKLKVLAEAYPKVIAGTPTSWSFTNGVFSLSYSTARAKGTGTFPAGAETDIAVPAVQFPHGYTVTITGATVASSPGATTLRVLAKTGAKTATVTVIPKP
jgi:endoglycosylceramidase